MHHKLIATIIYELPTDFPADRIAGTASVPEFMRKRSAFLEDLQTKGKPFDLAYYLLIERLAVLEARAGEQANIKIGERETYQPTVLLTRLYAPERVRMQQFPEGIYLPNMPLPIADRGYNIVMQLRIQADGKRIGGTDIRVYRISKPTSGGTVEIMLLRENLTLDGTDDQLTSLFTPLLEDLPTPAHVTANRREPDGNVDVYRNALYRKHFSET